jgi:hypothetical protein
LLGICFSTSTTSPAIFVLVIIEIVFHFTSRPLWPVISLFVLPWDAGMTGTCHPAEPMIEMGLEK